MYKLFIYEKEKRKKKINTISFYSLNLPHGFW